MGVYDQIDAVYDWVDQATLEEVDARLAEPVGTLTVDEMLSYLVRCGFFKDKLKNYHGFRRRCIAWTMFTGSYSLGLFSGFSGPEDNEFPEWDFIFDKFRK